MAIRRTIFQDELRSLLGKKGITYREFERISGVSKTYLTKILVHGLVPSKKIIESIAKSLNIMPEIFVEYKIFKIIHRFEKIYKFIDEDNLNKINNILDGIEETLKKGYEISKLSGREQINFNPDYYLNIDDLDEYQRRALNILLEEFRRVNVEKKIEFIKSQTDKNKVIIKYYNHIIQERKKEKGEMKKPEILTASLSPSGSASIESYRGEIEKRKKQNKLLEAELKNLKNEL